jgi:Ca-activated chloride channel family protein
MKTNALIAGVLLGMAGLTFHGSRTTVEAKTPPAPGAITQGSLITRDGKLECPLKHTDVKAEISGFLARVTVTQEFENTAEDKIEAVYVFPLPHNAAVDSMTMLVGNRTIKSSIKRREEARAIYEAARDSGRMAALLDQERPNIFTQSVANIKPREKVKVTISYVERLPYEAGTYSFVFPMVVGPRYIPGNKLPGEIGQNGRKLGGGWAYDTDRVPDASRITPHVAKPGTRAGHDISVEVKLDAGVPIEGIVSGSHEVEIARPGSSTAVVKLKNKAELPNKDLIVRYDAAGGKIKDAVLTHRGDRGGFFSLILQPPDKLNVEDVTPKELVFVLDTSGSMNGFPIEKAKETMKLALAALNPQDTFNLITFSGDTHILFPEPVPATASNLRQAQDFLATRSGRGGTEMMKAIRAALDPSDSQKHIRVVCFMTDGYVGNDEEIIMEVKKHANVRVFSFGIGNSVNRYLLDKMAEVGRGEVEYVSLRDDGSAAARRFHERVRSPLLTDISVEWSGLPVTEIYPQRIPDLFSAKPVVLTGRYAGPAKGTVKLRGTYAGRPVVREIPVDLPASDARHDVLATLWARTKVDYLMHQPNSAEAITQLGLEYRLMTNYTSFVAVEETVVTEGGKPRRVDVPVEMPDGVSYEGVFGESQPEMAQVKMMATPSFLPGRTANAIGPAPPAAARATFSDRLREMAGVKPLKLDPALQTPVLDRDGKVRVQVWLTTKDAATLASLKSLGFEVLVSTNIKMVIGRIDPAKLTELSELEAVKWVGPAK